MRTNHNNLELEHRLRIDWSDLDYFKHVNNVSFFRYIQSARVNFWEKTGLSDHHHLTNCGAMLASTHCEFRKALLYPGQVYITTKVDFVKNTSFGFEHILKNETGDTVAEARDVMVMYDFGRNEKVPVPDWLRACFLSSPHNHSL